MTNKIGWCNMTWNPVWGCRNHCEYCYARRIAGFRYKQVAEKDYIYTHKYLINSHIEHKTLENGLKNFNLTFLKSHFDKKFPKSPQCIFVGSMSEIYYWEEEWIEKVIEKVKLFPQHIFQFLTKFPEAYLRYEFPDNCWLGITVTSTENYNYYDSGRDDSSIHQAYQKFKVSNPDNLKFISFEPLLDEIFIDLEMINWVIIGAETGNRKGKIIPKKEWIEDITNCCRDRDIPIYLKDSLKHICPTEIKEFPSI